MAHHILPATCQTVHFGGFSPHLPPALTVDSGDTVAVETFSGLPVYEQAPPEFLPPAFLDICRHLPPQRRVAEGPHLLTGPIHLRNAQPGDVLEVRVQAVRPSLPVGFTLTRTGSGVLPERFSQPRLRFTPIDLQRRTIEFPADSGIQLPLRPFFGILGVATAEVRSSVPPGDYGGNLDNRLLQAPCRLWLPVFLPGAQLSVGDGHGLQGDGEVCVTALETAMDGELQLICRRDLPPLPLPLAETPDSWITMGFGVSLDDALKQALSRMIEFLGHALGLSPADAYMLCSLGIDFRITQAVNRPRQGVHGVLPKALLPEAIQLLL